MAEDEWRKGTIWERTKPRFNKNPTKDIGFKVFVQRMYFDNMNERYADGVEPYKNLFAYYRRNRDWLMTQYCNDNNEEKSRQTKKAKR